MIDQPLRVYHSSKEPFCQKWNFWSIFNTFDLLTHKKDPNNLKVTRILHYYIIAGNEGQ